MALLLCIIADMSEDKSDNGQSQQVFSDETLELYREMSEICAPHVKAKTMGPLYRSQVAGARRNNTLVERRGDDGALVGFVIWRRHSRTPTVRVDKVAVRQGHEDKGLGSSMMKEVLDVVKSEGRDVLLSVAASNAQAVSFYEKLGFSRESDDGRKSGSVKLDTMRWSHQRG